MKKLVTSTLAAAAIALAGISTSATANPSVVNCNWNVTGGYGFFNISRDSLRCFWYLRSRQTCKNKHS